CRSQFLLVSIVLSTDVTVVLIDLGEEARYLFPGNAVALELRPQPGIRPPAPDRGRSARAAQQCVQLVRLELHSLSRRADDRQERPAEVVGGPIGDGLEHVVDRPVNPLLPLVVVLPIAALPLSMSKCGVDFEALEHPLPGGFE